MAQVPVLGHGKKETCIIMVVDEDEAMRAVLVEALQENNCRVIQSDDGNKALEVVKNVTPNVIVTDLKIPNGGYPYLRQLTASSPESSIVVMTAHGDKESKARALECGAQRYFEKPLHLNELKSWICQSCLINPCGNIS